MKILLVSSSILPRAGGSSVIVENLAQNFHQDELVVFGGTSVFKSKTIERRESLPKFIYHGSEIDIGGRGARFFKKVRKFRFGGLVKKLFQVAQEEQVDYIIGVYPDSLYCLAACAVSKMLDLPFSSYFHNTYVENVNIKETEAREIQAEIFDTSQHIFVMSQGMQRFYEQKYQLNKFIPLVHTFNEYPNQSNLTGIPKTEKTIYQLVAIGNFNESNLDATRRLVNAIKDHPKYELNLYTHVPKLLLQKRGIDTNAIHHRGFVTPDQVHEVLQQYDICVLTHGFTGGYGKIEYKTIFPTRTIPLLLSGKPIFAHSPDGSFLNDFIRENECAELVDEADENAILEGLENITNNEARQKELVKAAQKTAQQFYGKNVVKKLKDTLSKRNDPI